MRSAVILLDEGKLALIRRERAGRVYYLLPGGSVESGETLTETAEREAEEELGVRVKVGHLIAEVLHQTQRQFYFLASRVSGEFGSGAGEEMVGHVAPDSGTYKAVWLPASGLLEEPVYPRDLCQLIVDAVKSNEWPAVVISIRDDGQRE